MFDPQSTTFRRSVWVWLVASLVGGASARPTAARGDDPSAAASGAAIYRSKCASCHGAAGEGSKDYAKPLVGEKSIGQLARLVEQTMPEDDPGSCVGEEARSVAAYIHESFYSRTALERNRPARVELSRLTVRQYRNTVADLVGSFHDRVGWSGGSGLDAQYFKAREIGRKEDQIFSRVDPVIAFDFGVEAPRVEGFDRQQFSIRWSGSVFVPDTGEVEFIVRSDQAIRLFVNNTRQPLIDGSVVSVDHAEQRAALFLLGGRPYPIRLEFSKAKQGVDDSKDPKKKPIDKRASVALRWKIPGQVEEAIPARHLAPNSVAESFVPTTPFPPDDRSVGYERGSSISKEWDAAITESAIEVSAYVSGHLRPLANAKEDDPDRAEKLRAFCRLFAARAFRRPLDADREERYVGRPFAEAKTVDIALRRSILAIVKSPYFLYREVECGDGYDAAARLAYGLWDAPPDEPLLAAARQGRLATREQVEAEAGRMLGDVRARTKLREFFLQWLKVDQAPDLAKDPALYPGFDPAVVADLRISLELSLADLAWGPTPDFRRLLDGDKVFLNGRLAKFYGYDLPAGTPFQPVDWEPDARSGIMTHPYLLAHFAYTATSSPIHRGVFLMRSVLGRTLRPPPEAIAPLAPDLHAGLSTRERVALQTSPKACVNCHSMINPLGFGLEEFDAIGRRRDSEKGRPVDASGTYEGLDGTTRKYRNARELGSILAASPETHAAFVAQLFHHQVKQPIRAFGPEVRASLTSRFAAHDFDLRQLLIDIAATSVPLADPAGPPKTAANDAPVPRSKP